jgi:hypothetical protein
MHGTLLAAYVIGQYVFGKDLERVYVTKPEGFISCHGLDNFFSQRATGSLPAKLADQLAQRPETALLEHSSETTLDEIMLVITK